MMRMDRQIWKFGGIGVWVVLVAGGCIAYRAPMVVLQRGPETNYNQERSGVMSRSTGAEQQVADATAEQNQQENAQTGDMPTAMESTRQVGLKQGQANQSAKTQGDQNQGDVNADNDAQGQQGGDAIGKTPFVNNGQGYTIAELLAIQAQINAAVDAATPPTPPETPAPGD